MVPEEAAESRRNGKQRRVGDALYRATSLRIYPGRGGAHIMRRVRVLVFVAALCAVCRFSHDAHM